MFVENMHFIRTRCIIFLLLIFILKFTFAEVENVPRQVMTPAKVFTNFLKVPWINLNSSWTDKVAPACRNDITTLFESANAGEMWALQMLDAASKIPAGILTGNIRDLGMYEECIRVKAHHNAANIQGQHCMISMSMPPKIVGNARAILHTQKLSAYNPTAGVDLNFASSVCLPSSCDVGDIAGIVNASIQSTTELVEFGVEVAEVTCSSVPTMAEKFTLGTILTILFFALVAIFLVFCTACEFLVYVKSDDASPALQTLAKFSLCANAIKFSSTEISPGTMPAINGIKFLTMCYVVLTHRVIGTLLQVLVNLSDLYEITDSWLAPFVFVSPFAIDTFFMISGFLTAYSLLNHLRSGAKFNVLKFYLHRYLRLTPCIVAVILISIFILPLLGSGPLWEIAIGRTGGFCRNNWWSNLLYIQNLVHGRDMCLVHTWYSAVEMQFYWLSPIILYPLFHRPKLGLVMLSMLLIASIITPAVHLLENQYSFLFDLDKIFIEKYEDLIKSYTLTYNRGLPYFVGILLAYYVVNKNSALTKVQVAINWILACILLLFCLWSATLIQPVANHYNAGLEAMYVSVGRLSWSLAMAWILYACTQGYGGPVGRFLSLPIFLPLSRLNYGVYLISVLIQAGVIVSEHTATYHSIFGMVYLTTGDLAMSFVAAFVLNLCFETPVLVLEQIYRTERNPKIIKHSSTKKQENLATIIRRPHDLTNYRGCSSSAIQARMLKPDFWLTVSDALHRLGKGPTKTPAEWVKKWQDWNSDLSENDSRRKNCVNGAQNGSVKYESGIITSEKELLIFLATVSCGFDDVASPERSEIAEDTRSQLVFNGSENGDNARILESNFTHLRKRQGNL